MKIGFILLFVFVSGISFGKMSGVITARDKDVVNGRVAEIPRKVQRNFDKLFEAWKISWQTEMAFSSNTNGSRNLKQYPKLRSMGPEIIPLVVKKLMDDPDENFIALVLYDDLQTDVSKKVQGMMSEQDRAIKTVELYIDNKLNKNEFEFRGEFEGVESGKAVLMRFPMGRDMLVDTFAFDQRTVYFKLMGQDTLRASIRVIGENLGVKNARGSIVYPLVEFMVVPGESVNLGIKVEKGKVPKVKCLEGGFISRDFILANNDYVLPAEWDYRQLTIDNIIRGGDIREYKTEFNAYMAANKERVVHFVRSNPRSYISVTYMLNHYNWFDENELDELYEKLPLELRNSIYGRTVKQKLERGRPYRIGAKAPEFVKKDMEGKVISLAALKGKYVLLDFWGSWCGPCRASHPHLKELHKKYGDRVVFINVAQENIRDVEKAREQWIQAVNEDGMTWTQVLNNEGREECDVVRLFNVTSFPTKILIDANGVIVGKYIGDVRDVDEGLEKIQENNGSNGTFLTEKLSQTLSILTDSCASHVNLMASDRRKTVYNSCKQPVSCEDNLKNLFAVWPVEKINNARDIELVSYTSCGLLTDSLQINYYADLMSQWDTPYLSKIGYQSGGHQGSHSENYITISTYRRMLEKIPRGEVALAKEGIERELLNIRKLLLRTLKVGYRVFYIKFKYLGEEMNTYIFCDSNTHEVVFDVIFLGLSL